jgi:ubiquitin C-terminal hydrolase
MRPNVVFRVDDQPVEPDRVPDLNARYQQDVRETAGQQQLLRIHKAPPVLLIHLNRYRQGAQHLVKIGGVFKFPEQLCIDAAMTPIAMDIDGKFQNRQLTAADFAAGECKYRLEAVVVHTGDSAQSGHYKYYSRNSSENGLWYAYAVVHSHHDMQDVF